MVISFLQAQVPQRMRGFPASNFCARRVCVGYEAIIVGSLWKAGVEDNMKSLWFCWLKCKTWLSLKGPLCAGRSFVSAACIITRLRLQKQTVESRRSIVPLAKGSRTSPLLRPHSVPQSSSQSRAPVVISYLTPPSHPPISVSSPHPAS